MIRASNSNPNLCLMWLELHSCTGQNKLQEEEEIKKGQRAKRCAQTKKQWGRTVSELNCGEREREREPFQSKDAHTQSLNFEEKESKDGKERKRWWGEWERREKKARINGEKVETRYVVGGEKRRALYSTTYMETWAW